MSDTLQLRPAPDAGADSLLSVVYASTATVRFGEIDLALLLAVSRMNNEPKGLTGLLLHRDGQFMQALEGPAREVRKVLGTISRDIRHTSIWILDEEPITERRFGSWAMGYRSVSDAEVASAPAWFGSPEAQAIQDDTRAGELLTWFRGR